ncbi:hypothetical protein [Flavobacterium sp.]|uniref:hypothetical protein n=1 Tax=Flavobacterium sp. TaxID=239 RepID=UPI0026203ABC|nr:hypothetical protein [Flavobacterium sp.]
MKWNKIKIWEIRKEAHKYLFKEINGVDTENRRTINFYYYVLPIILAVTLVLFNVNIDKDVSTYLITGISIFAGLFFNLLIVVGDKMDKRKKMLSSSKEDARHYAELYKNFSKQLISYISFAIILSLLLITLMFVTQIDFTKLDLFINSIELSSVHFYLKKFFNFLIFYTGTQFIIILLIILSNMYVMLLDDINLK